MSVTRFTLRHAIRAVVRAFAELTLQFVVVVFISESRTGVPKNGRTGSDSADSEEQISSIHGFYLSNGCER
jgi:hypothetical protein